MTFPRETILNVDDTEAVRYAKTRTLGRAGFTVVEAGTGAEALARVAETRPVLVLLDVKLPDMSGLEVCRAIKCDYPGTLVLQTSASFVESSDRVRGLENGADSYLTEPVEPAELVAAVEALVRLHRAEEELRRLNATLEERVQARTAELAQANARLQSEMNDRLRAEEALRQSHKMEAIGQLTGGLAHDFNNLLTGIVGGLELAKTRIAQGRARDAERYADAAVASARRAAALTHRLLAFARRQPLDPKPVDVNALVASMEELVRRTVGPAIAVETALARDLRPTLTDANQLESALLNLVINARDAMPEGGRLSIETANADVDQAGGASRDGLAPGPYVTLAVTDSGVGMAAEVLARAFDPFFTTKPIGQGTGLGLSQIYGFAKQSGGHVCIRSTLARGTTVRIYLPQAQPGAGHVDAPVRAAAAPAEPAARTPATVLVVDDEPVVRMLVAEVLQELGYTALEAADGAAGLRLLRSTPELDLLVTDIGLPGGVNGRELADAARDLRPGLKVLFITGYAEHGASGTRRLEHGMAMLTKPFALDVIAARIRHMVEDRQPSGP